MKQIFLSIQNRLAEIEELSYIDKDWGQLQYEQPPVQWPCALIDVANIDYTQQVLRLGARFVAPLLGFR